MNRSTKSLLRATVFAPAAAAVAMAGAPAHAGTGNGPLAAIVTGPLKSLTGKSLAVPGADLAHPTRALPAGPVQSADGLVTMANGMASVSRAKGGAQKAVATLGQGGVLAKDTLPASPARGTALLRSLAKGLPVGQKGVQGMVFSGVTAKCVTSANGAVAGSSTIDGGKLLGAGTGLRNLPVNPPINYRVPTGDPGFGLTLNKQVQDPTGGTTVSAVSVSDTTGALQGRDLGVAHCAPVAGGLTGKRSAQRQDGPTDAVAGLLGQVNEPVQGLLGGLIGAAPALPGAVPAAKLPVDPAGPVPSVKDALPAGLGDAPVPVVPNTPLSGVSGLFGGLPGLPIGNLPVTSMAGKLPVG
jgi:hypothetical protein